MARRKTPRTTSAQIDSKAGIRDEKPVSFIYRINERDEITWISDTWVAFAGENDASELSRENVIAQQLWRYITDSDTASIYRNILKRVRGSAGEITLPFRCDSPDRRRFMELTLVGRAEGEVEFISRLLREEPRARIALLDRKVQRSDKLVKICAWCDAVQHPSGGWCAIEDCVDELAPFVDEAVPGVTHGMCPSCHASYTAAIREMAAQRKKP